MKRMYSVSNDIVNLEAFECSCGFHVGIDTYWLDLDEAKDYNFQCPACKKMIPVEKLSREQSV